MKLMKQNKILLLQNGHSAPPRVARRYEKVYVFSGKNKYAENLPCDLLLDVDISDSSHRAGVLIDEVYARYVEINKVGILNEVIKDECAFLNIKKTLLYATREMFYSQILAERFIEKYQIKIPIDFIPREFPYSLYKIIYKKEMVHLKNIVIPEWFLVKMKLHELFYNLLLIVKLILYPTYILLCTSFKLTKNKRMKHYKFGIHIWDSWINSVHAPYTLDVFDGNSDNSINSGNSLYIVDGDISNENIKRIKTSEFEVCIFKEMIHRYSCFSFLKNIYPKFLRTVYKLAKNCNNKLLLSESYLRAMQIDISWEIFFSNYKVNTFISLQDPGNVQRAISQKKHNSRRLFILWSTICDRLVREDMETFIDSYYSHMIFDAMFSSFMSNMYCKKNKNFINEYVDCGIFNADIVYKAKNNSMLKNKLKKELKIPENKVIIGFFDTNMAISASLTIDQGAQIFDDIIKLLDSNDEYFFIYRSRSYRSIQKIKELKARFEKFTNHERVCYVNKAIPGYFAYDVMGICDLNIGIFSSSVPLESIGGGVPAICYLPSERFYDSKIIVNQFPNYCVRNYEQLKLYSDYWLNSGKEAVINFQETYVKKYIDKYCDGQARKRLHEQIIRYSMEFSEN